MSPTVACRYGVVVALTSIAIRITTTIGADELGCGAGHGSSMARGGWLLGAPTPAEFVMLAIIVTCSQVLYRTFHPSKRR